MHIAKSNSGDLTSKKTKRNFSSNEQMLSNYWAVISGLRAVNNDCSFTNQTDGTAWQWTAHYLIRSWAAPRLLTMTICGGIN